MSELGKNLAAARGIRGWTQEELGQRTGLKNTAISHFESGRRAPNIANLIKLSDALRVPADDLLGRGSFQAETCPNCGGTGVVRVGGGG